MGGGCGWVGRGMIARTVRGKDAIKSPPCSLSQEWFRRSMAPTRSSITQWMMTQTRWSGVWVPGDVRSVVDLSSLTHGHPTGA